MSDSRYIGYFTPSPPGGLYSGSLIVTLRSCLQARAQRGIWRVHIENIDPPREVSSAVDTVLRQPGHYGLHWDGDILWQSQRHGVYREAFARSYQQDLSCYYTCTRARIQSVGGTYDDHCRELRFGPEQAAACIKQHHPVVQFTDQLCGRIQANPQLAGEDFIIHRHGGLLAYNLAVVVDDHFQGVTGIVHGVDFIEPTVRQISLYQQLGWQAPGCIRFSLAFSEQGTELSKQNHTPALPQGGPRPVIIATLCFPGHRASIPQQDIQVDQILEFIVED